MFFQKSAITAWKEDCSRTSIITMSKVLDRAIGNGIPTQVITEFAGPPGSGKTQMWYVLIDNAADDQ